jgi:two-component system LytT family response regulator
MSAAAPNIRAVIVDDEAPARARLRQLLKDEPGVTLVAECATGRQALEVVQRHTPDLVFLDIQMPGLTGLQLCESLIATGIPLPLLIFVTAHDVHALKAFEFHAADYLLKPFDRQRFSKAVNHARARLHAGTDNARNENLAGLLAALRKESQKGDRLVFKHNGRVVFIRPETVDWVEADGNYVRVHAGGAAHHFRETLTALEAQLPAGKFMRISRSIIVNLDRIKECQPLFYGDYVVILHNGAKLSMSRNYRDRLDALLRPE